MEALNHRIRLLLHRSGISRFYLAVLLLLLISHATLLALTHFTDWPEMILYPWFLSKGMTFYGDVTLMYPPGAYYLLYPFYRVLGFTIGSERLIASVFILTADIALFTVSYRMFRRLVTSVAVTGFFILWQILFLGNTIWYETLSLPLYILAFYFAERHFRGGGYRSIMLAGLLLTLAFLLKQTALAIFAVTAVLILARKIRSWREGMRDLAAFITPLATVIAVLTVVYSISGLADRFLYWVFLFPVKLSVVDHMFRYPPPIPDRWYLAPGFLPVFVLIYLFVLSGRRRWHLDAPLILLWILAFLITGMERFTLQKIIPAVAFSALSIGIAARYVRPAMQQRVAVLLLILVVPVFTYYQLQSMRDFVFVRNHGTEFFGDRYTLLSAFIRDRIGTEPYFVFGNYDYIYMATDSPPRVRPWTPLFPWNWQVPGVQEALIRSIEAQRIPYILYIPYHPDNGFYGGVYPDRLYGYMTARYYPDMPLPGGGYLYKRNFAF